jgi:hypothetical protein
MHYLCPNIRLFISPLQVKCVIVFQSLHQAVNISEHITVATSKVCGLLATISYRDYLVLVMNEYGALVD